MSEQFKTSQESNLQQDVAKVLGIIPWTSLLLTGALNNNSPAFAQEVKYTRVEQLANQAEIQPAKKAENTNSSLQEIMSKIPADVKPGDSFLVKKNPDGTFTFTPQTIPVNDKCKPQIPTNPVTFGIGAGRGGVNITPGKNFNVTLGGRRIDLQNGSVDNATFASFLWQPELCVPLRFGAEYSLLENRKGQFGSETWIGVTYGINPSFNGAIIRRTVSPDGKSSDIGFSGTMQISF